MLQTIKDPLKFTFPKKGLNRSLKILIATNAILVFVLGLFGPFYAVFILKIGGTMALAGLSWAILGIVTGVLTLLFSKWEIKVKEQELLIAMGYLIRSIAFLSYAFMNNLTQLFITQILWGVAVALGSPAFDTTFSKHTNTNEAVSQWGSWEGISNIATGIAALVGGLIIDAFGFRIIFLSMSAATLIIGVYIWILPREVL